MLVSETTDRATPRQSARLTFAFGTRGRYTPPADGTPLTAPRAIHQPLQVPPLISVG
jgi:hypothetical protein